MVPDAIDEWVIEGAHLTVGLCDMHFCKVNKISILGDSEDEYRYQDLIYGGRRFNVVANAPNVVGGRSSSSSSSASSDDDLSDEKEVD